MFLWRVPRLLHAETLRENVEYCPTGSSEPKSSEPGARLAAKNPSSDCECVF